MVPPRRRHGLQGVPQILDVLELMPRLGADHPGDDHECHYAQRIGIHAVPYKILVQNHCRHHSGKPQKQPKRTQMNRANIDIGKHNPRFLKYSGFASLPHSRYPKAYMSTSTPAFPPAAGMEILISKQQIAERTREIGEQITKDYKGQSIVLIGVLKGAAIFLADLARAIQVDNTFDFVAVSSYGRARVSSGAVKLIKDIDNPIEGKHVILVEDILDTGLTLSYLRGLMLQHKPASLKIATCLDKPERRLVPIEADYVAFKIPNQFVIGYGMDYAERYRGVDDIRIFPSEVAGH